MQAEQRCSMSADKNEANEELNNEVKLEPSNGNSQGQTNDIIKFDYFTSIRLAIICGVLVAAFLNTLYGFALPHEDVKCIVDESFLLTANINKYLKENVYARHIIIAFSSFCIDFVIVYMTFHWALYGKSWRLMVALTAFYSFRGFVQTLFKMQFPEGYLWENPGFPTLTISYLRTSDFFFSGHVGFPIIMAAECYKLNKKFIMMICFFTCLVEAFTMVVTRGHYIIDLITGLIVSHYVYILVDKFIYLLDESCIGMGEKPSESNLKDNKEEFLPVEIKSSDSYPKNHNKNIV